jgi:hypothetical protein
LLDATWGIIHHTLALAIDAIRKGLVIVRQNSLFIKDLVNDNHLPKPVIKARMMHTDNPAM